MQRFMTLRLRQGLLARLFVVGALTCSLLAASSPCGWMMAASAGHSCCKKGSRVAITERCHEQSISSCCAKGPQTVAVTSSVAWSFVGLAPQGPVHQRICSEGVSHIAVPDTRPSSYLQDPVLRI